MDSEGTFLGPPPLVRLKKGVDTATFRVTPNNFTFQIVFLGFSPLDNADPITDRNPGPFNARFSGDYHYLARVTDPASGNSWTIVNCPEIGVDV